MRRFFDFFLLAAAFSACSHNGPELLYPTPMVDLSSISHGMMVLGDRLDDPYTVENMQAAYDAAYGTKAGRRELSPTDIYVRFLPENDSEYERLLSSGLTLMDHPLDYQILTEGDYYHDPELPEDHITWQYAVVGQSYYMPDDIRCEILDHCYIPAHDVATKSDGVDWHYVERLSYEMTGNSSFLSADACRAPATDSDACCTPATDADACRVPATDEYDRTAAKSDDGPFTGNAGIPATKSDDMPVTRPDDGPSKPRGRISIVDDMTAETEGLKGVKVVCNSFVKFGSAYTDEDGSYQISTEFAGDVRYRLLFQNKKGFNIGFNLVLIPASFSTLGEGSSEGVSAQITAESDKRLFTRSVVNNAGYDYFEQCEGGDKGFIATPPVGLRIWIFQHLGSSSAVMLQHGVMLDNALVKKYLGEYAGLLKSFLPDLTIGVKGAEGYADVYARAIHEFAHASHFSVVGTPFWDKYSLYIIQSFVTSGGTAYGTGAGSGSGYCAVGEMWGYFMENLIYSDRYGTASPTASVRFWFSPNILRALHERGLTRYEIFSAMDEDVTSAELLEERLKSLYPDYYNVIEQAFARY